MSCCLTSLPFLISSCFLSSDFCFFFLSPLPAQFLIFAWMFLLPENQNCAAYRYLIQATCTRPVAYAQSINCVLDGLSVKMLCNCNLQRWGSGCWWGENPKLLRAITFLPANVAYLHKFRGTSWTSSKLFHWIHLKHLNLLCFVLWFCWQPTPVCKAQLFGSICCSSPCMCNSTQRCKMLLVGQIQKFQIYLSNASKLVLQCFCAQPTQWSLNLQIEWK